MSKDAKTLAKIGEITKHIPAADLFRFFNNLIDAYKEQQTTEREIERIKAGKEIMLAEITNRYQTYKMIFERLFDERRVVIDRHFDVIDRGIAAADNQMILGALEGLSRIVSTSPFANIQELSRLLESGKTVEF